MELADDRVRVAAVQPGSHASSIREKRDHIYFRAMRRLLSKADPTP